jgi:hypothetical protein
MLKEFAPAPDFDSDPNLPEDRLDQFAVSDFAGNNASLGASLLRLDVISDLTERTSPDSQDTGMTCFGSCGEGCTEGGCTYGFMGCRR